MNAEDLDTVTQRKLELAGLTQTRSEAIPAFFAPRNRLVEADGILSTLQDRSVPQQLQACRGRPTPYTEADLQRVLHDHAEQPHAPEDPSEQRQSLYVPPATINRGRAAQVRAASKLRCIGAKLCIRLHALTVHITVSILHLQRARMPHICNTLQRDHNCIVEQGASAGAAARGTGAVWCLSDTNLHNAAQAAQH